MPACTATSTTATGSSRSRTCSIPTMCRSATPRPSTKTAWQVRPPRGRPQRPPPWSRPRRNRPPRRGKDRQSFIAGNGHGWTSNTSLDDGKRSSAAFDAYKKVLADKVGAARADEILTPRLHNSLIYPNMSIMGLNIHVRVIKPIAVDRTEVNIYPIRLCGAPAAMNFRQYPPAQCHPRGGVVRADRPTWSPSCGRKRACKATWTTGSTFRAGSAAEEADRARNATRGLANPRDGGARPVPRPGFGYMGEAA